MAASLLVLTDFYPAANRALEYAAHLAEAMSGNLILLHVRRTSLLDPERFTEATDHESLQLARVALARLADELTVPTITEVRQGRVAAVVAEAIQHHHPSLLVLGRSNTESIPEELVTTTSVEILRATPYPMLVLPEHVASTAVPRRLLVALDGEAFRLGENNGMLHQLLTAVNAQLTLLHISPPHQPDADAAQALDTLQQTGLTLELPPVQTKLVRSQHPAKAILRTADPAQFDLVLVVARPRSFLGKLFHRSVTAQVLLHSALPVLVVPAAE